MTRKRIGSPRTNVPGWHEAQEQPLLEQLILSENGRNNSPVLVKIAAETQKY